MSHTPKPRSSAGSVGRRVTLRDSKSSKKDARSTEDESWPRDQELDAKDRNEESTEIQSLSEEELQVLDDLHALELVLGDLINRRSRGSDASQAVRVSSSRRSSSSFSDAKTKADEKLLLKLEDQTVQEDVRGLDRFLDELNDRRAQGRQTPPVDDMLVDADADAEKAMTAIDEDAQLRDSRLSQIVAINDDITKEIEKLEAELRNTRTKGILKTGTGQSRLSIPFSLPQEVARRSTFPASEVTEDDRYVEKFESQGEEAFSLNLEGVDVLSQSSSVQTIPPSTMEPIVQYNSDFSTASPNVSRSADPFIRRAIQRILDLKTLFPDQKLYLIPSSSFPVAGIPHPISSMFELPVSTKASIQVTEAATDSSSFSGRIPSISISSDANATSFVEMEAPSEKANATAFVETEAPSEKAAIPVKMENIIGQAFLDYFNRPRPQDSSTTDPDAATPRNLSEVPVIVQVPDNETTVIEHHFVVPNESKDVDELEQRGRTFSLPVEFNGAFRQSSGRARETSPAILVSAVSPAQPDPTKYFEVIPDYLSGVRTSVTSTKSEVSGGTRKSSLRSAAAAQSSTKQLPVSRDSSSNTIASVPLATESYSTVKKKVSFADMPSTMYIIVNRTPEESDAILKPSVGFKTGWETEEGMAPKTVYQENGNGNTPEKSPSSPLRICAQPRLTSSTPSYPLTADALHCCSSEANRTSTETVGYLIPSSHVVTGSITHVMTRARSSAEQGRVIGGSRERWVTRVNSRNLSCSSNDSVCPCCKSGSSLANACDCLSCPGVYPPTSYVATAFPLQASCSNCMANTNCSCSRTRSGEESDSPPPATEHSSMGSFPEDIDPGSSFSSLGDCNVCTSDSQNRRVRSAEGTFWDKCDIKKTNDIASEK